MLWWFDVKRLTSLWLGLAQVLWLIYLDLIIWVDPNSTQADRSLPGVLMKTMKSCNWSCISQAWHTRNSNQESYEDGFQNRGPGTSGFPSHCEVRFPRHRPKIALIEFADHWQNEPLWETLAASAKSWRCDMYGGRMIVSSPKIWVWHPWLKLSK